MAAKIKTMQPAPVFFYPHNMMNNFTERVITCTNRFRPLML